jgi:hypothetical protein
MWWKLLLLAVVAALLIVAVIPFRTRAVKWDVYNEPPPQTWSIAEYLKAMYFTPSTLAVIALILIVAAALAFWIVRASN